jgi:hypothetical protein
MEIGRRRSLIALVALSVALSIADDLDAVAYADGKREGGAIIYSRNADAGGATGAHGEPHGGFPAPVRSLPSESFALYVRLP